MDRRVTVTYEKPYIAEPSVSASLVFNSTDDITDQEASNIFDDKVESIVVNSDQNGFTILLNKNAPRDLRFSWNAFAVKDPQVFESVIDGLTIEPEAPPPSNTETISAPADTNGENNNNSSTSTTIDSVLDSNQTGSNTTATTTNTTDDTTDNTTSSNNIDTVLEGSGTIESNTNDTTTDTNTTSSETGTQEQSTNGEQVTTGETPVVSTESSTPVTTSDSSNQTQ